LRHHPEVLGEVDVQAEAGDRHETVAPRHSENLEFRVLTVEEVYWNHS
jgi:hypothetical protein